MDQVEQNERELRRRMVEALLAGDKDLAWKLLRECLGLPPEGER